MHKSVMYPTMNHTRRVFQKFGLRPIPPEKRFLMKLRAAKLKRRGNDNARKVLENGGVRTGTL